MLVSWPNGVEFQGMLTCAPVMLDFFEQLKKAARTEAPVLIRGESGTGKELAAQAIHRLSARAQKPFYAINCATLSRELVVSELFGHVKGSFTGATQTRRGLFEVAHSGSLFLDEIAELPLDVQPRLLRVLEDHTFTPLGSSQSRSADVRLISATHESLRRASELGRFRSDLLYRIRVIPLFLPPLRERAQDIPMLAYSFLQALNQKSSRHVSSIEKKALDALMSYAWPGNIRELFNAIEFSHAMGEGPQVLLKDLPPELRGVPPPGVAPTWSDLEREKILNALRAHQGSRSKAAESLQISRATLWRKMRELKISL